MNEPCNLHDSLFEQTVRIEEAWPFPNGEAPERLVEAITDALDNKDFPPAIKPYFDRLTEAQKDELFDGGHRADETMNEIAGDMSCDGVFGWLGVAATPVFTPTGGGAASLSWGHYHTQLLFAPTGEQLLFEALEWSKRRHAKDMGKKVAA